MYTLKNADSDFKKGLVKQTESKQRFSVYLPDSIIKYLDEVAEQQDLGSRNQAVIQAIKNHRNQGGLDE